jgi:hypothetical protein
MIDLSNLTILPYGRLENINLAVSFTITDRWPEAFTFPPKPLALGISEHVIECLALPAFRPAVLRPLSQARLAEAVRIVVGSWCNVPLYVAACKFGEPRIGLHGIPLGYVTKDEEQPGQVPSRLQ